MKKIFLICFILILLVSLNGCKGNNSVCSSDSDCVPKTCCHPTECIPKNLAPNCAGMFCSMDCEPKTMDCGQGECKCVDGKCKTIFNWGLQ